MGKEKLDEDEGEEARWSRCGLEPLVGEGLFLIFSIDEAWTGKTLSTYCGRRWPV